MIMLYIWSVIMFQTAMVDILTAGYRYWPESSLD